MDDFSEFPSQFSVEDRCIAERAIVEPMAEHEWMGRRALELQAAILQDARIFRMEQMKLFMRYESQRARLSLLLQPVAKAKSRNEIRQSRL